MGLIENMMVDCVIMDKRRTPDGEGGVNVDWVEAAPIRAAIVLDSSMQSRTAQKQGVTSVYTVTTGRGIRLEYHDVIKRLSDGKIFRITSDAGDKESPQVSTLDMAQVTAEKWELTK